MANDCFTAHSPHYQSDLGTYKEASTKPRFAKPMVLGCKRYAFAAQNVSFYHALGNLLPFSLCPQMSYGEDFITLPRIGFTTHFRFYSADNNIFCHRIFDTSFFTRKHSHTYKSKHRGLIPIHMA